MEEYINPTSLEIKGQEKERRTDGLMRTITERVNELGPEINKWYTDFHENPELGGEERETSKKVADFLRNIGVEVLGEKIGLGTKSEESEKRSEGTGVVAVVKGNEDGPTIALRADMDALPVQEKEDHEPCSKKKNLMHACGHDTHTSALMGASQILKELADKGELKGNVVLIFQPSEEKAHQKESGAVQIIKFLQESGWRDKIKAFFGLHVFGEMERGKIRVKEDVQTASSGEMDIILKGPGGHIINIYEQPDLHNIFSRINVKLKEIFEPLNKEKKALVASARTKYSGLGYNVLPDEAEGTWVLRVADPLYKQISKDIVDEIKAVVNEAVQEELRKTGSSAGSITVDLKRRLGYRPIVHRDKELVDITKQSAEQVVENYKGNIPEMLLGGEDFSFYLEKFRDKEIPGVFAMVGGASPEKGFPKTPHHSPDFRIDPGAIKDMAALYAAFAVNAIENLENKK